MDMNNLFMVPSLVKWYGCYGDYDYSKLTEEEKMYLDYYNDCIFNSDKKIKDASFKMQMLILEFLSRLDKENEMSDIEISERKQNIFEGLTQVEIDIIDAFGYACSQVVGIFSEEKKQQRELKKERNDKNE